MKLNSGYKLKDFSAMLPRRPHDHGKKTAMNMNSDCPQLEHASVVDLFLAQIKSHIIVSLRSKCE